MHTQQVPSKPLLSFNQITNYQTPITTDNNNQQQSLAAIDDTTPLLVVRQKSKGVARTPTTNPKLVSTPVIPSTPFPNPAFDADAQIMEACDMPLSTIPTTIDTYDDTYVTRMQQYLDRAWELEQSQTLSFIAEAGGEVPSATSASVPTLSRGKSKRGNAAGGSGTLGRAAGKPLIDRMLNIEKIPWVEYKKCLLSKRMKGGGNSIFQDTIKDTDVKAYTSPFAQIISRVWQRGCEANNCSATKVVSTVSTASAARATSASASYFD
ncbi:hypothetical protein HDU79_001514, partial [Rhizoclosmatium sp. JEL0117]